MNKKELIKNFGMIAIVILVVIGIIVLIAKSSKNNYEFDVVSDNDFIKESSYMEVYNANTAKKTNEITKTIEVDWSDSNSSSVSKIKKVKVVAYVKADGREYFLTEKGLVYTKKNKKFVLLKSKATRIGLYESKPVVETGNRVYYIEVKNGKFVIDNELKMEVTEVVSEVEEIILPKEESLSKNIKNKLVFNTDKEISFENGDKLVDKESKENIKALYAIYIVSNKESRYYIVSEDMKLYIVVNDDTELESNSSIKSVLTNAKGIEIDLEEDKLVFEKK